MVSFRRLKMTSFLSRFCYQPNSLGKKKENPTLDIEIQKKQKIKTATFLVDALICNIASTKIHRERIWLTKEIHEKISSLDIRNFQRVFFLSFLCCAAVDA